VKQDNGSKHTSKIIVTLRKTTREVANDYLTQTTGRKLQTVKKSIKIIK
jgi:hypothetical protein